MWLVLNILCKKLSDGSAPQQCQWLDRHAPLVAEKLVALFFGRVRSGQQTASSSVRSASRPPLPAATIVDWAGVEQSLLPVLPLSVQQPVFDAIARVLNGPCVDLPPSDREATTTQMQPRKWSRHVLDCLTMAAAHQAELSLLPMTRRFWTELLDGLLDACDALCVQGAISTTHSLLHSRAEFVLRGVLELLAAGTRAGAGAGGGQTRFLLDPAVIVDTWTSALLLLASTAGREGPAAAAASSSSEDARQLKSNLLAAYMDAVRTYPAADRAVFLSSLLDTVADYCRRADIRSGFIIRKGCYTALFSQVLQSELLGFVSTWLDEFYPTAASVPIERTR